MKSPFSFSISSLTLYSFFLYTSNGAGTGTVLLGLTNGVEGYWANVSVGTPGQQLSVHLDTGSSDLWLPAVDCDICNNATAGGCPGGSFDPTKSTTYTVVGEGAFDISYVDGTGTSGDYFTDTLSVGGTTLDTFTMGLGSIDSTIGRGVFGIGYDNNEAYVTNDGGDPYFNLIDAMVESGAASSYAYSLWLDDIETSTGSILFGGIDTSKYSGDLMTIDIYLTEGHDVPTDFNVAFTSLSVSSSSGTDDLTNNDFPMPVVLDSGTTLTFLPTDLVDLIYEEFGVSEEALVPCSLAQRNGTINYGFGGSGGPIIKVPVDELVLPIPPDADGKPAVFTDGTYKGQAACEFGIIAADSEPFLFGDTFLRSAYVVYDLYNAQIALAQTVFNSSAKANVVPFASKGAQIPSAKTVVVQSSVVPTATGAAGLGPSQTRAPVVAGTGGPSLSAAAGFTGKSTEGSGPKATGTGNGVHKSGAGSLVFDGLGKSKAFYWGVALCVWLVL